MARCKLWTLPLLVLASLFLTLGLYSDSNILIFSLAENLELAFHSTNNGNHLNLPGNPSGIPIYFLHIYE